MRTRVTKNLFEEIISTDVPKLFVPLGFVERESGAFVRQQGNVLHGFGLTPDPSFSQFHVPVGAYVMSLVKKLDYVDFGGPHYPTLLVSRWLGEFKGRCDPRDCYYHFATVEELRQKLPLMYADFVEQAEPWLAQLTTVEDVAREFHKLRIAPLSNKQPRPPDPYAWAIHGWLLEESGQPLAGRPWLEQAYQYLQQPLSMQHGRLIPRSLPSGRPIPLSAEDARLLELLRKDLKGD